MSSQILQPCCLLPEWPLSQVKPWCLQLSLVDVPWCWQLQYPGSVFSVSCNGFSGPLCWEPVTYWLASTAWCKPLWAPPPMLISDARKLTVMWIVLPHSLVICSKRHLLPCCCSCSEFKHVRFSPSFLLYQCRELLMLTSLTILLSHLPLSSSSKIVFLPSSSFFFVFCSFSLQTWIRVMSLTILQPECYSVDISCNQVAFTSAFNLMPVPSTWAECSFRILHKWPVPQNDSIPCEISWVEVHPPHFSHHSRVPPRCWFSVVYKHSRVCLDFTVKLCHISHKNQSQRLTTGPGLVTATDPVPGTNVSY